MKSIRDKKGHYRKFLDSVDEEIETLREIQVLFKKLEFNQSHWWVIRWMIDYYGFSMWKKP